MISLHRYRSLLREPHIGAAIGASVIGRLPIGMAVLSILLFVQQTEQSFARAGMASAAYVVGIGLAAPFIGRLMDRLGPRPLLVFGALAYPLALAALIAAVQTGAGGIWIAGTAFVAGMVLPPIPTSVRALLRRLLRDPGHLQAAYSLDSVLMETVFIVGPGVVSIFAAFAWPAGAVACTAAMGFAGAIVFARSPAVRAWSTDRAGEPRSPGRALATPGLLPVLAVTVFFSLGFGLFEVAVTAIAARARAPAAAGVILALASVGSALGALVYGSRSWPGSVPGQYKAALGGMAIGLAALAPVEDLHMFGAISILAGAPMSTVLAAQSVLIAGMAPRAMLAECFTWSATSLLAGVSLGIAVGGWMLEHVSPAVTLLGGAITTAIALGIAAVAVHPVPSEQGAAAARYEPVDHP
ncbi:MAG: MFS transporter [Betaproteobacteria bacterium]|nr:MAG: MFS transporter [Betaproteobacteria bacterium]